MLRHQPLLESNQAGVAVSHVQGFIVVQPGPLAEPSRLESTGYDFLLPKCAFGKSIFCWLMRLVGNVLWHWHGITGRSCGHSASTSVGDSVAKLAACLGHKVFSGEWDVLLLSTSTGNSTLLQQICMCFIYKDRGHGTF